MDNEDQLFQMLLKHLAENPDQAHEFNSISGWQGEDYLGLLRFNDPRYNPHRQLFVEHFGHRVLPNVFSPSSVDVARLHAVAEESMLSRMENATRETMYSQYQEADTSTSNTGQFVEADIAIQSGLQVDNSGNQGKIEALVTALIKPLGLYDRASQEASGLVAQYIRDAIDEVFDVSPTADTYHTPTPESSNPFRGSGIGKYEHNTLSEGERLEFISPRMGSRFRDKQGRFSPGASTLAMKALQKAVKEIALVNFERLYNDNPENAYNLPHRTGTLERAIEEGELELVKRNETVSELSIFGEYKYVLKPLYRDARPGYEGGEFTKPVPVMQYSRYAFFGRPAVYAKSLSGMHFFISPNWRRKWYVAQAKGKNPFIFSADQQKQIIDRVFASVNTQGAQ